MNINFDIKLSKSQQEMYELVHNNKYKFYTFIASRQSGKTVLMQCLLIEWLLNKKNTIAYVCRNFILAKKLYRDLIKLIPKQFIKSCNGADLYIESIFNSTLMFASAEQGASLRGQTFTHMICDEFAFHKQEQTDGTHLWNDILSPRLKARGKKCIFITTPLGKQNIAYEMYVRGLSDEYPNYISLIKTIYDDGFITQKEIDEIKKSIPDISFRSEYLCEFIDGALTVFPGFDKCFIKTKPIDKNEICWFGIDLSSVGEDRTVVSIINKSNVVEQYIIEGELDEKYKKIADIINKYSKLQKCYIETNGVGSPMTNEIKKLVKYKNKIEEFITTNSTKKEIVGLLQTKIANKEIWFDKKNTLLFSEFGTFIYTISKSNNIIFNAQDGKHDDTVMSLAIALKAKEDIIPLDVQKDVHFIKSRVKNIG